MKLSYQTFSGWLKFCPSFVKIPHVWNNLQCPRGERIPGMHVFPGVPAKRYSFKRIDFQILGFHM